MVGAGPGAALPQPLLRAIVSARPLRRAAARHARTRSLYVSRSTKTESLCCSSAEASILTNTENRL